LQPKPQAEPDRTSWNEFCGLVLEIIAELSPCPEPTLFVVAATRDLQRFGDGTLDNLSKLLGQCVQELQARGLVQLNQNHLVITPAESTEDDDILELTTVVGSPVNEDILLLTAELELQPSLEAQTNQEQPQMQAHSSGGRKQTSEPTREEIIAAMHRFISEH
jgi:hypothetical protein